MKRDATPKQSWCSGNMFTVSLLMVTKYVSKNIPCRESMGLSANSGSAHIVFLASLVHT